MGCSNFNIGNHLPELNQLAALSNGSKVSIWYEELGFSPQTATINCRQSSGQPSAKPLLHNARPEIYRIASYTKILINVAYVNLLRQESGRHFGLSWNSLVCDIYKRFRTEQEIPTVFELFGNPTLGQLLKHVNGIAPINQYLFAPDGSLILSKGEFLDIASRITKDRYEKKYPDGTWVEYSNGNHILAGIMLEMMMKLTLQESMYILVFKGLDMNQTFMDEYSLARSIFASDVMRGHRVSAHGNRTFLSSRQDSGDAVGAAAFGAYSSTQDIASLNRSLLEAITGKSSDEFDCQQFFLPDYSYGSHASTTLAGIHCSLGSPVLGMESLSRSLVPLEELSSYTLGNRPDGTQCKAYFKSGCVDGYTCSTYLLLNDRMFTIVLTNSSGALDISGHVVSYILQEALRLFPRADVIGAAAKELELCSGRLGELESQDGYSEKPSGDFKDLAGIYEDEHFQKMTIEPDGTLTVGGKKLRSSLLTLNRISPSMVKICPGKTGFGIERWTVWDDLSFEIVFRSGNAVALVGKNRRYKRVPGGRIWLH